MKISEVHKKARYLGIRDTWLMSKKDMIRAIQRKEGNFECFGTPRNGCEQYGCCWREDCLKK